MALMKPVNQPFDKTLIKNVLKNATAEGFFAEPNLKFIRRHANTREISIAQVVNMRGCHLRSLGNKIGLCINLQVCILHSNYLTSIEGLEGCTQLVKIDLHDNHLSNLPPRTFWRHFQKLKILYLHNNGIKSLQSLSSLGECHDLALLTCYDTPVSLHPNYRHFTVNTVFSLKALDHYVVADEEIIEDASFQGKYACLSSNFLLKSGGMGGSFDTSSQNSGEEAFEEMESIRKTLRLVDLISCNYSPIHKIQRAVREFLRKRHILDMYRGHISAMIRIQRFYRRRLERRTKALHRIQFYFRQFNLRRLCRMKNIKWIHLHKASLVIQTSYRQYLQLCKEEAEGEGGDKKRKKNQLQLNIGKITAGMNQLMFLEHYDETHGGVEGTLHTNKNLAKGEMKGEAIDIDGMLKRGRGGGSPYHEDGNVRYHQVEAAMNTTPWVHQNPLEQQVLLVADKPVCKPKEMIKETIEYAKAASNEIRMTRRIQEVETIERNAKELKRRKDLNKSIKRAIDEPGLIYKRLFEKVQSHEDYDVVKMLNRVKRRDAEREEVVKNRIKFVAAKEEEHLRKDVVKEKLKEKNDSAILLNDLDKDRLAAYDQVKKAKAEMNQRHVYETRKANMKKKKENEDQLAKLRDFIERANGLSNILFQTDGERRAGDSGIDKQLYIRKLKDDQTQKRLLVIEELTHKYYTLRNRIAAEKVDIARYIAKREEAAKIERQKFRQEKIDGLKLKEKIKRDKSLKEGVVFRLSKPALGKNPLPYDIPPISKVPNYHRVAPKSIHVQAFNELKRGEELVLPPKPYISKEVDLQMSAETFMKSHIYNLPYFPYIMDSCNNHAHDHNCYKNNGAHEASEGLNTISSQPPLLDHKELETEKREDENNAEDKDTEGKAQEKSNLNNIEGEKEEQESCVQAEQHNGDVKAQDHVNDGKTETNGEVLPDSEKEKFLKSIIESCESPEKLKELIRLDTVGGEQGEELAMSEQENKDTQEET
eukprot:Nk52_evm18s578 gene=Nk52_evmTU18s578